MSRRDHFGCSQEEEEDPLGLEAGSRAAPVGFPPPWGDEDPAPRDTGWGFTLRRGRVDPRGVREVPWHLSSPSKASTEPYSPIPWE